MSSGSRTIASPRAILPRWRPSAQALATIDTASLDLPASAIRPRHELEERTASFLRQPSVLAAADAVSVAVSLGLEHEVPEILRWLESEAPDHGLQGLDRLVASIRGVPGQRRLPFKATTPEVQIRYLRKTLARYPRNPLGWLDLGYAYATAGLQEKAERAVLTAVSLAPHSRIVVRPSSRFFVHDGKPDRAAYLLDRSDLAADPWIAAARVSVAQVLGNAPTGVRRLRSLLESVSPAQGTELAAALGTAELAAGADRKARRLFEASAMQPTENTLAQLEWAHHWSHGMVEREADLTAVEDAYEARTRHLLANGMPEDALVESLEWLEFEPYSVEPATFASYVASIGLADFEAAERIARAGLKPNPKDYVLLNNLAFALLNQDKTIEAHDVLRKISPTTISETPTLTATTGLYAFRTGDAGRGRELYAGAVRKAATESMPVDLQALIALFWMREESRISGTGLGQATSRFKALRTRTTDLNVERWEQMLTPPQAVVTPPEESR